MSTQVVVTIKAGPFDDRQFSFAGPTRCVVGRAEDCDVRVPNTAWLLNVSRHHCLLEIDPPVARVCDLGSRNGTYVNGQKIGQRDRMQSPLPTPAPSSSGIPLHSGDEIQIGDIVLEVAIVPENNDPAPASHPTVAQGN